MLPFPHVFFQDQYRILLHLASIRRNWKDSRKKRVDKSRRIRKEGKAEQVRVKERIKGKKRRHGKFVRHRCRDEIILSRVAHRVR